MRKRITLSTAISYMFIAMTVTFCLTMILSARMFEAKVSSVNEKESMYDKVSDIDQVVRQNYYTAIDDTNIFDLYFGLYDFVIVIDHQEDKKYIANNTGDGTRH